MESRDYQELAPKTSSGVHDKDKIVGRVGDDYHLLVFAMAELVKAANRLEQVKKLIFYGKKAELPYTDTLLVSQAAEKQPQFTPGAEERLAESVELLHGAIGMATEAGEFLDQVSASIFRSLEAKDPINRLEELGDISWYLALAAKANGTPFEDIWAANIAKLRKRYPDGVFDEKFAHNRDVAAERRAIDEVGKHKLWSEAPPSPIQNFTYTVSPDQVVMGVITADLDTYDWSWKLSRFAGGAEQVLGSGVLKPMKGQDAHAMAVKACDACFIKWNGPVEVTVGDQARAKPRTLQEHLETLEPGDRVRSAMPINGKHVEGVILKVEDDIITFDPSTLEGYTLREGEGATFRNYRKGAWVMVRKAQPYQHPQPGQTCACPHCVPGKYNLVSDRLDEASVEVEREAIGFGEVARRALIDDTAASVARPGVTWVGQGYALFNVNQFPAPDDLPLSFYWVDYHRLPDAIHDLVKAKMKDRERYHVGHLPTTPGPTFKLPGTSRVCTCASCMPPLPAQTSEAGA